MIKNIKLKIAPDAKTKGILFNLMYCSSKIMNKVIQDQYSFLVNKLEFQNKIKEFYNDKVPLDIKWKDAEVLGTSLRNYSYRECRKLFPMVGSSNVSQTVGVACARFSTDKKDILNLRKSIPSFKNICPVYISQQSYKISEEEDKEKGKKFVINAILVSSNFANENGLEIRYNINIIQSKPYIKDILKRIYTQELITKTGSFTYNEKTKKWYFNIAIEMPSKNKISANEDKFMEICPKIIDDKEIIELTFANKTYKINPAPIKKIKIQVQKRKKKMLREAACIVYGNRGKKPSHGRKRVYKFTDFAKDKVRNFVQTKNQQYAHFVIDVCVRHKIKYIIIKIPSKLDLKEIAFADLCEKISANAIEVGIEINKIKMEEDEH